MIYYQDRHAEGVQDKLKNLPGVQIRAARTRNLILGVNLSTVDNKLNHMGVWMT